MQPHNPAKNQKILVLGAGELGLAVVRALVLNPAAEVAVMLRPVAPEAISSERHQALRELESLGVEVLAGDAVNDSEEHLAASFNAFDTLVSCLGFVAGPGTQRKLTRAALQSDIKRYVPWQFGVDYDAIGRGSPQDLFNEQLDVRDLLRAQSRVQWLIISTGMFTSFLFEPGFGVVDLDNNTVRALGSWDTAVTVTTAHDIGRLTATILFDSTLRNQVVYIAGDTLTYGQLADTVERLLGRTLERVEWTVPALEADLRAEPDDQLRKYRAVFAQGRGVAWDKARTYNGERQIETTNVVRWIEQNLL
ncbi:aromatic alcohol reductase [Pseudomonas brassicacearum]|uniref:2'-hydroxyisoflavone reductase n=2 Tax=Pseudomonas TaxID=286 RepID=A0A0G3GGX5_9PSED|nr:aromatic alcohol reductase [Pseudomonas brassicacearum]AKK00491.1 2'-hydroxyisoflavone reductase [Pseudomonas chlororaphis]ROM83251.1 aromatic alcohol reductase [Pseudomonas brassicacearum]